MPKMEATSYTKQYINDTKVSLVKNNQARYQKRKTAKFLFTIPEETLNRIDAAWQSSAGYLSRSSYLRAIITAHLDSLDNG